MYTGCHCPVTAGQKGGGFGKWTSVTPGRKPIFPHPSGPRAVMPFLERPMVWLRSKPIVAKHTPIAMPRGPMEVIGVCM